MIRNNWNCVLFPEKAWGDSVLLSGVLTPKRYHLLGAGRKPRSPCAAVEVGKLAWGPLEMLSASLSGYCRPQKIPGPAQRSLRPSRPALARRVLQVTSCWAGKGGGCEGGCGWWFARAAAGVEVTTAGWLVSWALTWTVQEAIADHGRITI